MAEEIYYLNQSDDKYQQFLIKQNSLRYDVDLTENQKTKTLALSGGEPVLVKHLMKNFADGAEDFFDEKHYKEIFHELITPLSLKLCDVLQKSSEEGVKSECF